MDTQLAKFDETSFLAPASANLIKRAAAGKMEPNVVILEEGMSIEGVLVAQGAPIEIKDKMTGEEKAVPTFVFENDTGIRVALMASYQLEKQLPALIGKRVLIVRGETKRVGAKQVNQYIVSDVTDIKK